MRRAAGQRVAESSTVDGCSTLFGPGERWDRLGARHGLGRRQLVRSVTLREYLSAVREPRPNKGKALC
jgi:hypothetical protein